MSRVLITVCTYNEAENIRLLIPELLAAAPHADVLVVDDNSPDGTSDVVAEMKTADDRIRLITRPGKLGLGTATLEAFQYGIREGYDLLLNLDADFSHHPRHIPALLEGAQSVDVVIGSRYVKGGGAVDWSFTRKLMSIAINTWARLLLGLKTRDNSGSFRCYRVAKLALIDWSLAISRGYAFEEEILYRCRKAGCTFAETPITFDDRRHGVTKINWRESLRAVLDILRLGLHRLCGRRVLTEKHDATPDRITPG